MPSGSQHPNWKGGRYVGRYIYLKRPEHHRANSRGYVAEHILVAEEKYGRPIVPPEEVHHKDENKHNNHPDNLILCADHTEHAAYHRGRKRVRRKTAILGRVGVEFPPALPVPATSLDDYTIGDVMALLRDIDNAR